MTCCFVQLLKSAVLSLVHSNPTCAMTGQVLQPPPPPQPFMVELHPLLPSGGVQCLTQTCLSSANELPFWF